MKIKLEMWAWLVLMGITIIPFRQTFKWLIHNGTSKSMGQRCAYKVMAPISHDNPNLRVIQITDTFTGALQAGYAHLLHKL